MKNRNHKGSLFRRLGLTTVIAVYFLILVGGIVRSTGSGMGCPDWPKCFGKWIPPTHEAQLPENYETIFVEQRLQKNNRLAGYLKKLGYHDLADRMINDPAVEAEQPFNSTKTWIEYINRLIGVVIGFLIMGTVVTSVPYLQKDRRVFYLAVAALILVIFQGWLGSVVVSTNLLPGMVTTHMLFALVIVALLINAVFISYHDRLSVGLEFSRGMQWLLGISILISVVQIVLGTQVRESLDVVAATMQYTSRDSWIAMAGSIFPIHRSYSILIVLINSAIVYRLWKTGPSSLVRNLVIALALIILLSVFTGMIMAYLGIPRFAQPIHLLLGTVLVGVQFTLWLISRNPLNE